MTDLGFRIEVARREDVDHLLLIERECSPHPWTREHLLDAAGGPEGTSILVVRGESADSPGIVGFCVLQVVLDELHVHNLAVRPGARRRGHARRLLAASFEAGVRQGARRAFLEVRAGNREALALYRSCGFGPVGLRRGYYQQPVEDAVLLHRPDLLRPMDTLPSR